MSIIPVLTSLYILELYNKSMNKSTEQSNSSENETESHTSDHDNADTGMRLEDVINDDAWEGYMRWRMPHEQ